MNNDNKVIKELKFATFIYEEDSKDFIISLKEPDFVGRTSIVRINKTYAFAFMRFLIRISSRNWFRKQKKAIKGGENNE